MKVLLTGGSGFVGCSVRRQLREAGHEIRVLVRRPEAMAAKAAVAEGGVELCRGDIVKGEGLSSACFGVNAVIHLVGIIVEHGQQTFENVHARGTRNVVEAARAAGIGRIVHMSALGTRPGAAARYHQSKWAGEQSVRRSDMAWTIFRPSIIYGPGDGFVSLFERLSRYSPVIPVLGGGGMRLQPVPVDQVATCLARALVEPESAGQTYDLCGPEPMTLREILRVILRVTGRRRLLMPVPLGWMRLQATFLERFYPMLLRRPPPLTRDQLLMLEEDNVGDAAPARARFGLSPIDFEAGLAACLKTPRECG